MGSHYLDEDRLNCSIAAIATALGPGAIGIVRISGLDAIEVGSRVFEPRIKLTNAPSHTIHIGRVCGERNTPIDTVLASVMRAPNTFTGENSIEFNTHGGPVQTEAVLRACIEAGALPALPGEFTFRRFMNGKIDLTQAESVADLIEAKTALASSVALRHHDGALRVSVEHLLTALISLRALCEASIDFVEEGIPELQRSEMLHTMSEAGDSIVKLTASFQVGRRLREGAQVVLTGPPNVGKSSLFNAILKSERAIVTSIPGTTRDALTELIDIYGVPVVLADTAGIRESQDVVEAEGVRRSLIHIQEADLVVQIKDRCSDVSEPHHAGNHLIVLNKVDELSDTARAEFVREHAGVALVSAKTGEGVAELCQQIRDVLMEHMWAGEEIVITRRRHFDCLQRCQEGLARAELGLAGAEPLECVAAELRGATAALEELTGKVYDETILNRIFGEFCIGK
jgi:tRNA modification GTPase